MESIRSLSIRPTASQYPSNIRFSQNTGQFNKDQDMINTFVSIYEIYVCPTRKKRFRLKNDPTKKRCTACGYVKRNSVRCPDSGGPYFPPVSLTSLKAKHSSTGWKEDRRIPQAVVKIKIYIIEHKHAHYCFRDISVPVEVRHVLRDVELWDGGLVEQLPDPVQVRQVRGDGAGQVGEHPLQLIKFIVPALDSRSLYRC